MDFLAGDVGGTKTLLGIFRWDKGLIKIHQKKYSSSDWDSIEPILSNFINNLPHEIALPTKACLAVAGPVTNGQSKLTNLGWELDRDEIIKSTCLESVELINDICVLIYSIPFLNSHQITRLQIGKNKEKSNNQVAVIASGTGLGIARGVISKNNILALPSEGGHKEFAARNETEWELSQWLKSDLNIKRLSIEQVISGNGLGNIARWRLSQPDAVNHPLRNIIKVWRDKGNQKHDFPNLVSETANKGDQLMQDVLEIWLGAYGSAAGDLALQELCEGGLWIAGGTAAKQLKGLSSSSFIEPMKNKGRFCQYLDQIPVTAMTDQEVGLIGAACKARMLAE